MRDLRDFGKIVDLQGRVGRRFKEQNLGVCAYGGAPLREVCPIDQRAGDAEARQPFVDDVQTGAEQRPRGDDMIADAHQAHQSRRHGRHAGRGRLRGLGAFEQRHPLLEHRDGGIGEARIDEAWLGLH